MDFEKALKTAMREKPAPEALDGLISERLAHWNQLRVARMRVLVGAFATVIVVLAVGLYPTLSAQAALNRIAGALDGVSSVIMTRYNIDEKGNRIRAGFTAYDRGKWRTEQTAEDATLFLNGRRYFFDSFTNCYVVEPADGPFAHNSGSIKLSSMLGEPSAWGNRVVLRTAQVHGQRVRMAQILNEGLQERYTIFADVKSDLPISGYVESLEGGKWNRRSEMAFRYDASIDAKLFELKKGVRQLSKDEWRRELTAEMTSKRLAVCPLDGQELVIRAMEVSKDGTVFIAFQSGSGFAGWRGTTLQVTDDVGTTYIPEGAYGAGALPWDSIPKKDGGRMEFEVFVPVLESPKWEPRSVTVALCATESGKLVRYVRALERNAKGEERARWIPNNWGDRSEPKPIRLLTRNLHNPTCEERPSFMPLVDFGAWRDELTSRLTKAGARARHYLDGIDATMAARYLREQLYIMGQIERRGGGPYSREGVLKQLRSLSGSR